jgi:hypothetical protein
MWLTIKKYKGNGSVKISSSTEYHLYKKYINNLKIRYDLGLMPLYFYRVSGRGRLPYLFKPTKGFNNQIVYSQVYNIFARSIQEVVLQLKNQEFSGYVYKIHKYEKAIFNKDFINDVNDGIVDPKNYGFIDVTKEFCKLPEAIDYCNYSYEFIGKGDLTVNYSKEFIGGGKFKIKGLGKITQATIYYYKVKIKNKIKFNGTAITNGINLLPTKTYNGSGSIKINVGSNSQNNNIGIIEFLAIGNFEVTNFNNYTPLNIFNPITNNVVANTCSCPTLKNVIYFSNSIFKKNSLLDKFLYRNNLSGSDIITLYYDNNNQHYFNTIKFNGLSLLEGNKESWNVTTTLNCTNQLDLNKNKLWLFSCSVIRNIYNSTKTTSLESKLAIFLPYNMICSKIDAIEFYNRVNLSELVVYNKYKDKIINVNINVFKDKIKLFTSGNWLTDPYFNIFVYSNPAILESYFRPEVSLNQEDIRKAITGRQDTQEV